MVELETASKMNTGGVSTRICNVTVYTYDTTPCTIFTVQMTLRLWWKSLKNACDLHNHLIESMIYMATIVLTNPEKLIG